MGSPTKKQEFLMHSFIFNLDTLNTYSHILGVKSKIPVSFGLQNLLKYTKSKVINDQCQTPRSSEGEFFCFLFFFERLQMKKIKRTTSFVIDRTLGISSIK